MNFYIWVTFGRRPELKQWTISTDHDFYLNKRTGTSNKYGSGNLGRMFLIML